MGRQTGILPLKGRLAGISYYEDKLNGPMNRTPGGPSRLQIKTKRNMAPVRKNNSEFGKASSNGKLIRQAFATLVELCRDPRINTRLVTLLQKLIKADNTHKHGSRVITEKNLASFKNFDLSSARKAEYYFRLPVTVTKKKDGLTFKVKIKLPEEMQVLGGTHWKVISVLAGIDFQKEKYNSEEKISAFKPVKDGDQLVSLSHTGIRSGYYFHGMCIQFFQYVDGKYEELYNKDLRAGFIEYVG